ncbi:hypothetical protein H4219_003241 [Mycoemilia scoparia]|uniref:Major facilitator superfamily (MFS) profile domain-containing protein n=1 Tax=Mycoemilia scoparia TaxID=417184 RepID=A0A9W7ZVE1_9FUNG|nr:hypothetical protein H4219_003241 [Mycoemilia scoparia]
MRKERDSTSIDEQGELLLLPDNDMADNESNIPRSNHKGPPMDDVTNGDLETDLNAQTTTNPLLQPTAPSSSYSSPVGKKKLNRWTETNNGSDIIASSSKNKARISASDSSNDYSDHENDGGNYIDQGDNNKPRSKKQLLLSPLSRFKNNQISLYVLYIVGVAAISGLLFGYDTGVISGALVVIKAEWNLNSTQQEFVVGATTLGAIVGGLSSGYLSDLIGRKLLTIVSAIIFIGGALIMTFAPNFATLVGGRGVVGLGVGMASMVVPMYIGEVSPKEYRGRLVTINVLAITGGQLIAYLITWGLADAHNGWRWMFAISAFPVAVQLLCMPWFPESPRHLIKKGKVDDARKILEKIYSRVPDPSQIVDEEIKEIQHLLNEEGKVRYRDLLKPSILRCIVVACGLQAAQQLTGFNTVMYYSSTILKMAGFSTNKSATQFSITIAATNMIMTIVAITTIDRYGRRRALLLSLAGMTLGLILIGVAFIFIVGFVKTTSDTCTAYPRCGACILDDKCGWSVSARQCLPLNTDSFGDVAAECLDRSASEKAGTWVALVSLILYVAFYGFGLGNIPWLVQSEIFSHSVRSKAASFPTATNWSCNFLISMTFLTLTQHITPSATFWLFAGISVIAFVFIFMLLHETKGLSLEQVQRLFQSKIPPYRSKKHTRSILASGSDSLETTGTTRRRKVGKSSRSNSDINNDEVVSNDANGAENTLTSQAANKSISKRTSNSRLYS